jgi:hypothetical protein
VDAGQDRAAVPGRGLDARYEQLRHAALHARAEAFPLGLAVLTRQGVTSWHRTLTDLTPDTRPAPTPTPALLAGAVSAEIAAELVDALAAVVLAAT